MSARGVSAFWLALAIGALSVPALAGRAVGNAASVGSTVHVILGDSTSTPPLAAMKLIAKPSAVTGGRVMFSVANTSTTLEHELLVVRVPGNQEGLPYNESSRKIVEDRIDKVGDSGDLRASTSTTFTVALKPGKYLLMCNEPGHYRAGMWEWLMVRGNAVRAAVSER